MKSLFVNELQKLKAQPAILFWGFLAVPLMAVLFRLSLDGLVFLRTGQWARGDVDLLVSSARLLGVSGNSVGRLLYAIGISAVFFAEYRYSTWRLLVPRASRVQLWGAKYLACLATILIGLLLALAAHALLSLVQALMQGEGSAVPWVGSAQGLLMFLGALGIALMELAVLAALVAALTILSRSMFAAVIPAFLLAIGASILQVYLGPTQEVIPLPSLAADAVRDWLFSGAAPERALMGLMLLTLWLVGAAGIGLAAFWRQELSAE
jgi:ABC-2 family transporter protein